MCILFGADSFRIFCVDYRYSQVEDARFAPMSQYFIASKYILRKWHSSVVLGHYMKHTTIDIQGPDAHGWQKNWIPFEHAGKLFACKSLSPVHEVVEIDPQTGMTSTVMSVVPYSTNASEANSSTVVRSSAPDGLHYPMRLRNGSYVTSEIRGTSNYVLIRGARNEKLLMGLGHSTLYNHVVYTMSLEHPHDLTMLGRVVVDNGGAGGTPFIIGMEQGNTSSEFRIHYAINDCSCMVASCVLSAAPE